MRSLRRACAVVAVAVLAAAGSVVVSTPARAAECHEAGPVKVGQWRFNCVGMQDVVRVPVDHFSAGNWSGFVAYHYDCPAIVGGSRPQECESTTQSFDSGYSLSALQVPDVECQNAALFGELGSASCPDTVQVPIVVTGLVLRKWSGGAVFGEAPPEQPPPPTGGGEGGGGSQPQPQPHFGFAFQANTGNLWNDGTDLGLGMMPGTSPSVTGLSGSEFEVAFQANTGNLWTVGDAYNSDRGLGMMSGTSPAIASST